MVRMAWYMTDHLEYNAHLKVLGTVYRYVLCRNFPAVASIQVPALVEVQFMVEVEVTAVLPD